MKERVLSILLVTAMVLFNCSSLMATVVSFPVNGGTPANIPDGNPTGLTRTFTVDGIPSNATINSVTINLNLSHTWVGDLRAALTSPDGETHTLFYDIGDANSPTGNGDSSDLLGNYLMSDAGATTLWTGADGGPSSYIIPPGAYRTTSINVNAPTSINATFGYPGLPFAEILTGGKAEKSLSDRVPEATNGAWTLVISDNNADDTGTLNAGTALNIDYSVPTAASAAVEGRLLTSEGRSVMNATVILTSTSTNEVKQTRSSSFGYFRFEGLPVGDTYVVQVVSKSYQFPPRILQLTDDVTDLIIEADGK